MKNIRETVRLTKVDAPHAFRDRVITPIQAVLTPVFDMLAPPLFTIDMDGVRFASFRDNSNIVSFANLPGGTVDYVTVHDPISGRELSVSIFLRGLRAGDDLEIRMPPLDLTI